MTRYLSLEDVLTIHDAQIAEYGGGQGVRDPGQLEAALFRPQTGYYSDIVSEAAALWESLSQNHPFIDGNKRTAFASMHVFLILNGYELTAELNDTIHFVVALYETHTFAFDRLESWLRAHARQAHV
ncbi:type II toxin-antitoxin system death-on-curing family toxin [Asticcacaulis excentricus]|uniref:Death-on-curing family protein n=1 Tax=Asticcacaulis excentricus (strain ATCC 15261 / DSM 4724 / KCTC 12464 / NCIMB 9791 / VKM B-1370 / CB 48) TaxID=573065 RepID=E8RVD3_ASTEC|nr:type II toxin-antitoxin system death-on-curing family toxin [Asticcacaulis excentricus]ADU15274.1 death-on-curing family protein [Asticcacaulis excentricus CB 48]